MTRLLVIDNHDSYTYNLVQALARLTGVEPDVVAVDAFRVETADDYDAIIISPGPGHPAKEAAFASCLSLLRTWTGPILGVCLGHQGLVVAHGGSVDRIEPSHGVVDELHHDGTGLFAGVEPRAGVVRYHSLAAREVPPILEVTATTAGGVVMAVAHRELPQFGVQFHPESVLTAEGERIVANFLRVAGIGLRGSPEPDAPGRPDRAAGPADLVAYPTWMEPERVARHLLRGRRRAFWLDSAERRAWTGRHSVLGYLSDDEPSVVVGGPEHSAPGVQPVERASFLRHLARLADEAPRTPGGPPAVGAWIGVAGYETQEVIASDATGTPADGFFMRAGRVVVFDHDAQTVSYRADTAETTAELRRALDAAARVPGADDAADGGVLAPESYAPWTRYAVAYDRLDEALHAGDTYEAVLTFPLEFTLTGDPLDHYLALRRRSLAPYAAYLRHDDEIVLSASPERMLSVAADRTAEVRPIKGTLPRSADPQQDAIARWTLATEDKFRRENLMITDLIRNDLGKVSEPGSIAVTQLMDVETYRGVHQLVSAIQGTLREGLSPVACLRAVFPAGSMTGAPKRRTMELIREVEPGERGLYAGALGWFDGSAAEFSVVIRTLHGSRGRFRLHVGGGIIIGSTPEAEFDEAMDKARSVTANPVRSEVEGRELRTADARAGRRRPAAGAGVE